MTADVPFLALRRVQKAFGRNVVFDGLDLVVKRGEILTVIGASGSGKSVMLKLLAGLLPVDSGEILVDGEDITKLDEDGLQHVRRRIAMVFQGSALFDSLSVGENISYPLREQTDWDEEKIRARVAEVLGLVDLSGIESKMPGELSGGMRKRVGLARGLAVAPDCILYDEPTTGLDPVNTRRIDEIIVATRKRVGATAIVVTHDMASAFLISDRIAMIDRGRIVAIDSVEAIRGSQSDPVQSFVHAMDAGGGRSMAEMGAR